MKTGSRAPSQNKVSALLLCIALLFFPAAGWPNTLPALEITQVSDAVFSAIGVTQAPAYENFGHNNNLSFILTSVGVVVVNGGDNELLAAALHREIRQRTELPVKWIINENGQGHAFLGNSYWAGQGVSIIAHEDAIAEMNHNGRAALARMQKRNKERATETAISLPTHSFGAADGQRYILQLGDTRIELIHFGEAHSPGDISVWLPAQRILIAGDIAFHQRLLGIFPDTDVAGWIDSFQLMAALQPKTIVPGHGRPTDLATLQRYTLGYLMFLRTEIIRILEEDGDLADAYAIDQSAYADLDTFDELAAKNAGRLYQMMEMDYF
ncbi:MAG: MBL fold metallo-hydrolase [Proteobacteria bacterium]|nr:MBL fold metallo-hydrolase [Pseudomonadota bacterium]